MEQRWPVILLPAPRASDRWATTQHCRVQVSPAGHEHARQQFAHAQIGALNLLNETKPFNGGAEWGLGTVTNGRLWTINLHYHAWIAKIVGAKGFGDDGERQAYAWRILEDWLRCCTYNAPGALALAWNSFAISTRLRWWGRFLLVPSSNEMPAALREALAVSAGQQARVLASHIEHDLCGNHLLRNAVGLAWAATLLDVSEKASWMRTAESITISEAADQILPDGGHVERSAMYHLHVLEDFAELALLLPTRSPAALAARDAVQRMAQIAQVLFEPDGTLAAFNDGGPSGAPAAAELLPLLDTVLGPMREIHMAHRATYHLESYGLIVHRGHPWSLRWDVGRVGPDWQPGHAHADTLTIDASVRGKPLLIDPGTHSYDRDARRVYDRSTRSHNTVRVAKLDSSECWDIFRVGRRAVPFGVRCDGAASGFDGVASHDGYRHLVGRPVHRRRVVVDAAHTDVLRIEDDIEGDGTFDLDGGWLLHPAWSSEKTADGWLITGPSKVRARISGPVGLKLGAEPAVWHPDYGVEINTTRLVWSADRCVLPSRIISEFVFETES